ncbi:hypothetical protein [Pseudomonas sp. GV071]|uniref:hypothetical protein n=1 Tax=Pseudomonas sp. GV071 TaxID=2135754 RepID=UPI000D3B350C|nr:hypothetical protein [Pseudomonas sp. GV071]PTQ73034.1 hypothetical protein C8K61_102243 [Pseudomonas sp. GV071]
MTSSVMPMSHAPQPQRRQGRLQLILLLALTIGPMVLATCMYQFRFWVPEGRNYSGELIGNGQSRTDLGIQGDEGNTWQIVVTAPAACADDCRQLVYLARQLQIGLGREASRATHGLATAQPVSEAYNAELARDYPRLDRYGLDPQAYSKTTPATGAEPQLWLIDPHGNLVLRYDAKTKGKAILNDLRLLLKLSNIG